MSDVSRYTGAIPPLNTISDPDVRRVLTALVNGWRTRNGETRPDSDERFITKGEIDSLVKAVNQQYFGQGGAGRDLVAQVAPRIEVAPIIDSAKQAVLSSRLFTELGDRVQRIDSKYAAGLASSFAAIQREEETRSNADNAIALSIETQIAQVNLSIAGVQTQTTTNANNIAALAGQVTILQAEVGENSAALSIEASARVNADLSIEGKYAVKVDLNGYVTGYGLIAESNTGTASSEFAVRADRFSIASPSGPGIPPRVPFVVQTTTQTLPDGTTLPPGVYMDTALVKQLFGAYIQAGLLDAAKIYTGSELIDRDSRQRLLATAVGSWNPGSINPPVREVVYDNEGEGYYFYGPATSSSLRFYGPNHHAGAPVSQRVRSSGLMGNVPFTISANATVDHHFSIWYRYNNGPWQFIAQLVETQFDYGTASISLSVTLPVAAGDFIDFGVAPLDSAQNFFNPAKITMAYLTMSVTAVNL